MPCAVTWTDPEILILTGISQTEKEIYCIILLNSRIKKKYTHELTYKTDSQI